MFAKNYTINQRKAVITTITFTSDTTTTTTTTTTSTTATTTTATTTTATTTMCHKHKMNVYEFVCHCIVLLLKEYLNRTWPPTLIESVNV